MNPISKSWKNQWRIRLQGSDVLTTLWTELESKLETPRQTLDPLTTSKTKSRLPKIKTRLIKAKIKTKICLKFQWNGI